MRWPPAVVSQVRESGITGDFVEGVDERFGAAVSEPGQVVAKTHPDVGDGTHRR